MGSSIEHIHDPLLVDYRSEDDRQVIERSKSFLDGLGIFLHGVAVLLYGVPFVDNHHACLLVSLDKVEYGHVLRLDTGLGIHHKDADIRVLYCTDGPHYGIEFKVLMHLGLLSHSGCVDQHELMAELVVKRCYGVSCRSCDRRYDIPFLA